MRLCEKIFAKRQQKGKETKHKRKVSAERVGKDGGGCSGEVRERGGDDVAGSGGGFKDFKDLKVLREKSRVRWWEAEPRGGTGEAREAGSGRAAGKENRPDLEWSGRRSNTQIILQYPNNLTLSFRPAERLPRCTYTRRRRHRRRGGEPPQADAPATTSTRKSP